MGQFVVTEELKKLKVEEEKSKLPIPKKLQLSGVSYPDTASSENYDGKTNIKLLRENYDGDSDSYWYTILI